MSAGDALCLLSGAVVGVLYRKELAGAGYRLGYRLGIFIVRWIFR